MEFQTHKEKSNIQLISKMGQALAKEQKLKTNGIK
jgi:hypothetical protein